MRRLVYIVKTMLKKQEKSEYPAININNEQYPASLREIASPPAALYVRGHIPKNKPMIGIVGTRRCTPYGKRVTEHIVKGLVRADCVIVSGMAIGIDSEAHKAALEAGGETIAVVGSGIDESVVYPSSNKALAREIEKHGAVISEFDPYARSETFYFPQRNRVISGLSLGVVVIESKERGGSLITANFALEQNREVFAVPGGLFWETSAGSNNLIKQGAKAVTCAEDILEELNLAIPEEVSNKIIAKNPIEQKIIDTLLDKKGAGVHIDSIVQKSKLSAPETSSTLTEMELDEKIKNLGGDYYVLT
jgi:DNA processing protein